MNQRLRAVIFDFDGVILESNDIKTEAFRRIFSRFPEHEAAMMDHHRAHVSTSRYAKFAYLAERLGRAGDTVFVDELAETYARELRMRMEACPLVPGARDLLEALHGCVRLFLASVTPEEELRRLLDHHQLARYFEAVFGCPPWTKTEAVRTIVRRVEGATGVVLIGDSAGDQDAARIGGVEFVARDSGLSFAAPLPVPRQILAIRALLLSRLAP